MNVFIFTILILLSQLSLVKSASPGRSGNGNRPAPTTNGMSGSGAPPPRPSITTHAAGPSPVGNVSSSSSHNQLHRATLAAQTGGGGGGTQFPLPTQTANGNRTASRLAMHGGPAGTHGGYAAATQGGDRSKLGGGGVHPSITTAAGGRGSSRLGHSISHRPDILQAVLKRASENHQLQQTASKRASGSGIQFQASSSGSAKEEFGRTGYQQNEHNDKYNKIYDDEELVKKETEQYYLQDLSKNKPAQFTEAHSTRQQQLRNEISQTYRERNMLGDRPVELEMIKALYAGESSASGSSSAGHGGSGEGNGSGQLQTISGATRQGGGNGSARVQTVGEATRQGGTGEDRSASFHSGATLPGGGSGSRRLQTIGAATLQGGTGSGQPDSFHSGNTGRQGPGSGRPANP